MVYLGKKSVAAAKRQDPLGLGKCKSPILPFFQHGAHAKSSFRLLQ